jgi:hypothetical protein
MGDRHVTGNIEPDAQDLDQVIKSHCREHRIRTDELYTRLKNDDALVAEMYRLAQAAKLTRLAESGE